MASFDSLGDHAVLITICALLFGLALLAACLIAVLKRMRSVRAAPTAISAFHSKRRTRATQNLGS